MNDAHGQFQALFTVGQTAKLLGVGRRTVWRLIADGEIATIRIGRRVLVRPEDLDAFIVAHRSRRDQGELDE